jgi:glycosyltransferase involved in cell wall biosynthesis
MSKKKKRKKNKGPTKSKKVISFPGKKIEAIPQILGANFNFEANDIERYQELVDQAPKRNNKIRILISNEASFLHTGFSTYGKEVLTRLHKTGKYEIAELGSYGGPASQDKRAAGIAWKYYHVYPINNVESEEFNSDSLNQFGKWKLTYALADFKPDVLMVIRDWWMDEHVLRNPLRKKVHVIWMPTVDGYPQKWEWLRDYQEVDTLLTYSHFGKRVVEEQSRLNIAKNHGVRPINVADVCQPGVDIDVFKPIGSAAAKQAFNIPADWQIVGSVMRNQPRKLFPRIIEAFSIFKRKYPEIAQNARLLLHTSIPDVGWDGGKGIIETIERQGVNEFVLFSYICRACGNMLIQHFMGSPTKCSRCGKNELVTPNTQFGYAPVHFNYIYNLMDVYIQGSIAEGDGMPINEAKAAGVPTIVSNYSAMAEKARNGGGLHIENATIMNESGGACARCGESKGGSSTMQWRSLFNRKHLAQRLAEVLGSSSYHKKLSREARQCAERYYNWDLTAKKWEALIDNLPLKERSLTWESGELISVPTKESPPNNLSDEEWLLWCYKNILCRTGVDNDGKRTWLSQLQRGAPRAQLEDYFRKLMKDNEVVAEALANPSRAGMDPMQKIADEIKEAEKNEI